MKGEKLTECHKKMERDSNKNTPIKKTDVTSVVMHTILKVLDVPQVDISANTATK